MIEYVCHEKVTSLPSWVPTVRSKEWDIYNSWTLVTVQRPLLTRPTGNCLVMIMTEWLLMVKIADGDTIQRNALVQRLNSRRLLSRVGELIRTDALLISETLLLNEKMHKTGMKCEKWPNSINVHNCRFCGLLCWFHHIFDLYVLQQIECTSSCCAFFLLRLNQCCVECWSHSDGKYLMPFQVDSLR